MSSHIIVDDFVLHFLDVFAFDMYDLDSDGTLNCEEVHVMFRELLGSTHANTKTNKLYGYCLQ
jgi:hypothetical protein